MTLKLAHTMIRVKDLKESLDFYTEFLGLKKVRESKIGDEAVLCFLTDEAGSYHLELTYNCDGREYQLGDQFGHLAFTVDDLDGLVAKVKEREWWFRQSRPELSSRYIFIKDPNGYDIEILQARK